MDVGEVFTLGFPKHTYVTRENTRATNEVPRVLETGSPIQLVGPEGVGKTSLVLHYVDRPVLTVPGSTVEENNDIAWQLFDQLLGMQASGTFTLPINESDRDEMAIKEKRWVVDDALESGEVVLLFDDFHLLPDGVQVYAAQRLKAHFERGVSIFITVEEGHRGDLFRANGDLVGRVRSIDVPKWTGNNLSKIATKGFDVLNVTVPDDTVSRLVEMADGSPRKMQRLCLVLCEGLGIREPNSDQRSLDVPEAVFEELAEE